MDRIDTMLANANSIEVHGKILQARGMRAVAASYFARAEKLRAEAAILRHPLALAA